MKIIVGGAAFGLYLAIQLHRAGVRDMVVIDPRADCYTRPGHLDDDVFERAEAGIQYRLEGWRSQAISHIKDIERALYHVARSLGIAIETKTFIGFADEERDGCKGLCVHENGVDSIIPSEYVFDCTGTKRALVDAVNALYDVSLPFVTSAVVSNVRVKKHFLAYVCMNDHDATTLINYLVEQRLSMQTKKLLYFTRSMVKLRAFGWQEHSFPYYFATSFSNEKVGVYTEAPDTLSPTL